jgi:hypothetical protein
MIVSSREWSRIHDLTVPTGSLVRATFHSRYKSGSMHGDTVGLLVEAAC